MAVPGVSEVVGEDRETLLVAGMPSGHDLIEAATRAVDGMARSTGSVRPPLEPTRGRALDQVSVYGIGAHRERRYRNVEGERPRRSAR